MTLVTRLVCQPHISSAHLSVQCMYILSRVKDSLFIDTKCGALPSAISTGLMMITPLLLVVQCLALQAVIF